MTIPKGSEFELNGLHYKSGVNKLLMRHNGTDWINVNSTVDAPSIKIKANEQEIEIKKAEKKARESSITAHHLDKSEVVAFYIVNGKNAKATAEHFDTTVTTIKNWYNAFRLSA